VSRELDTAPAWVAGSPRRFPDPVLVTQEGRPARLYDDLVRGRVVLLNFAYTRCTGSCPRTGANLAAAQRLLAAGGLRAELLTLSLDPEHDSPEAMRRELIRLGGLPGWTWLTGRADDLTAVRRFLGLVDRDPALDADRTRHTGVVVVGNDRAGRWSTVPGLLPPELIVEAVGRVASARR